MSTAQLEAAAHELIAAGHAKLAEVLRLRADAPTANDNEWLAPEASPLGKRRTLVLCRARALESSKVGRKVLVLKASLDAFLAQHRRGADNDLFGAA